jgi:hypothetical protein
MFDKLTYVLFITNRIYTYIMYLGTGTYVQSVTYIMYIGAGTYIRHMNIKSGEKLVFFGKKRILHYINSNGPNHVNFLL